MDLRDLPTGLSASERTNERRTRVEKNIGVDLSALKIEEAKIGHADEKNCEQMIGAVPIPVGYAGPLVVTFSSGEKNEIHLPLATTEGALVASVNRGCKVLSSADGVKTSSERKGTSRSVALKVSKGKGHDLHAFLTKSLNELKEIAENTSQHLHFLSHTIDVAEEMVFFTLFFNTEEAMGMNMVTIAAQAVGEWVEQHFDGGAKFITVAGNVDSDKKPSQRVHDDGRGFTVTAEISLSDELIEKNLKTTSAAMLEVAHAKLKVGSKVAGAIGSNLHAANIIAALYLSTGQDAAHVVEGSLSDTTVEKTADGITIKVRLPALMVGVRGGGTGLPAQQQCLHLLLHAQTTLSQSAQLAESIGAAVLAGEVSLLAAQASHSLAKAHRELGR